LTPIKHIANIKHLLFLATIILVTLHANCQKQGQARIDSLLTQLPKAKDDTNKVNLLNDISFTYYYIKPDEGIKFGKQALELANKLNWKKGVAHANHRIGSNYIFKSDYSKSLEYLFSALTKFKELKDNNGIARVFSNIGIIYSDLGDYSKALDYGLKALKINEDIGEKLGASKNMNSIGLIYLSQDDDSKALDYYFRALKIVEAINAKDNKASILNSIGNVYIYQKNYKKALNYYSISLKIDEEFGDKIGISNECGNIGITYAYQNDYSKALEWIGKALKLDKELGNKISTALHLMNIGDIYLSIVTENNSSQLNKLFAGNKKAALNMAKLYIYSAIGLNFELKSWNQLFTCYYCLNKVDSCLGDNKSALDDYKKGSTMILMDKDLIYHEKIRLQL